MRKVPFPGIHGPNNHDLCIGHQNIKEFKLLKDPILLESK